MKILLALATSFFLLSSNGTDNYEKITDEVKIQSLIKNFDQHFIKLKCENSNMNLYKKEATAYIECKDESGSMIIDKKGEKKDYNALLIDIIESDYKEGTIIEKAEVYFTENSTLVCLKSPNSNMVAYLKK